MSDEQSESTCTHLLFLRKRIKNKMEKKSKGAIQENFSLPKEALKSAFKCQEMLTHNNQSRYVSS